MINNIKGFHLELTNICTLKCPRCARTKFLDQFSSKWNNHSINLEKLKSFFDIDLTGLTFQLCGNYGDPIYYPHLFELCKWLKENHAKIVITTNGSYKLMEWWKELSTILDSSDKIVWSIDGSPENFTNYRINADWKSIKEGIEVITKTQINTEWKYIVFNYNEDYIEQVKNLSRELNIKNFLIINSDRWDSEDDPLMPKQIMKTESEKVKNNFKKGLITDKIDPICLKTKTAHFISADGYYMPCCFIGDHRFYYKTLWGKNKKIYKINQNTISAILKQQQVKDFYEDLSHNICPTVCQFTCGC
jgi:MoaA/NifB/PqqE/SkfB family radical SAM enzyme